MRFKMVGKFKTKQAAGQHNYTVIRLIFVVKILSYPENTLYEIILLEIFVTTNIFRTNI